jgi:Domain of unknown function (DUF4129)
MMNPVATRTADLSTRTAAVAIALTVLVGLVAIGSREPLRGAPDEPAGPPPVAENVTVIPPEQGFPVPGALPPEVFVIEEDPGPPAWLPWVVSGIAVCFVGIAIVRLARDLRLSGAGWRRRRRRRPAQEAAEDEAPNGGAEEDAEIARRAIESAVEQLRDPADPREAVIAAYARMQAVLAERQLGHLTHEAPREYLARVLRERGMPEQSLATLTDMFEEARFSRHPISRSASERALRELEDVRVALRATDGR